MITMTGRCPCPLLGSSRMEYPTQARSSYVSWLSAHAPFNSNFIRAPDARYRTGVVILTPKDEGPCEFPIDIKSNLHR